MRLVCCATVSASQRVDSHIWRTAYSHVFTFARSRHGSPVPRVQHQRKPREPRQLLRRWIHAGSPCQVVTCCSTDTEDGVMEMEIKIGGMVCDGCSSRVENKLKELEGVRSTKVNLDTGIATVGVDAADQLDAAFNVLPKLVDAVRDLGFEAEAFFSEASDV